MTELDALKEVERLAREMIDVMDLKLHGECDGTIQACVPCDAEFKVSEKCPKCGETVEIDVLCDNEIDVEEHCENDVELEFDDDSHPVRRDLRLALVQLDLARAKEGTCTCAEIQAKDVSRHFLECPLRAKYPKPLSGPLAEKPTT